MGDIAAEGETRSGAALTRRAAGGILAVLALLTACGGSSHKSPSAEQGVSTTTSSSLPTTNTSIPIISMHHAGAREIAQVEQIPGSIRSKDGIKAIPVVTIAALFKDRYVEADTFTESDPTLLGYWVMNCLNDGDLHIDDWRPSTTSASGFQETNTTLSKSADPKVPQLCTNGGLTNLKDILKILRGQPAEVPV